MKPITIKEIKEAIKDYNLGELISIKKLKRRLEDLQPSFILKTTKGKYFLKQYWEINENIEKGVEFNLFLQQKKYPCNKIILDKNKKLITKYQKYNFSIFEFMSYKEKYNLTKKEIYEYGKGLARLHSFSKNMKNLKENHSPKDYYNEFKKGLILTKKAPRKIKETYKKISLEYEKSVNKIRELPRGICHVEYTPQHTRYSKGKLTAVIDWDLISKGYFLYDIGTAVSVYAKYNKIEFDKIKTFLNGYESIRKLTPKEKSLLFEAIELGLFKFITWGLDKEEVKKSGWVGVKQANYLIDFGKDKFLESPYGRYAYIITAKK